MIEVDARYWTTNPVPSLQAARTVLDARADGDRPRVLPDIRGALMGYTGTAREVSTVGELSRCGIVLGGSFDSPHLRSAARGTFRYRWILPQRPRTSSTRGNRRRSRCTQRDTPRALLGARLGTVVANEVPREPFMAFSRPRGSVLPVRRPDAE